MTIAGSKPPPTKNPGANHKRRGSPGPIVGSSTNTVISTTTRPRSQSSHVLVASLTRSDGSELRIRIEQGGASGLMVDVRLFTPISCLARAPSPTRSGLTIAPDEILPLMEGLHAARLRAVEAAGT